jgi:hypothetical protein
MLIPHTKGIRKRTKGTLCQKEKIMFNKLHKSKQKNFVPKILLLCLYSFLFSTKFLTDV